MEFKIALVQFNPARKNVDSNIDKITALISNIKADLIVLPELANSGYLYHDPNDLVPYSEPADGSGPFLSALKGLSKSSGALIISGYAELAGNQLCNSAVAVSPDGVIENYRKIHLFADEKSLFEPGDQGFKVFQWKGVKIGMMICFDWIFPESARTLALLGAQIIAHPANLVLPYCQDAMITRSIENKVFTITANRIGQETLGEQTLQFTGGSQITAPQGNVLYRAPVDETAIHTTIIDPLQASDKTISHRNNLFDDRRPSIYHD